MCPRNKEAEGRFLLVVGGSASGKSQFAETLAVSAPGKRYYIATMEPFGKEAQWRIARHRLLRENKGFETVERFRELGSLVLPQRGTALLECVTNLLANEIFSPEGAGEQGAVEAILQGIASLRRQCDLLVAVSGEVGMEPLSQYAPETRRYMGLLGKINREMAKQACEVWEVTCGVPICHKGGTR